MLTKASNSARRKPHVDAQFRRGTAVKMPEGGQPSLDTDDRMTVGRAGDGAHRRHKLITRRLGPKFSGVGMIRQRVHVFLQTIRAVRLERARRTGVPVDPRLAQQRAVEHVANRDVTKAVLGLGCRLSQREHVRIDQLLDAVRHNLRGRLRHLRKQVSTEVRCQDRRGGQQGAQIVRDAVQTC